MKKKNRLATLCLIATSLTGISAEVMPSAFTDCYLDASVLGVNVNSELDSIDTLVIQVLSIDRKRSTDCPYAVGEIIKIDEVEHENISASTISKDDQIKLYSLDYQAMGENGPVSGTTWKVLEVASDVTTR